MPNVRLAPCKHGNPVTMQRTENGDGDHWAVANDCCESVIDWSWHRLARKWNAEKEGKAVADIERLAAEADAAWTAFWRPHSASSVAKMAAYVEAQARLDAARAAAATTSAEDKC